MKLRKLSAILMGAALTAAVVVTPAMAAAPEAVIASSGGTSTVTVTLDMPDSTLSAGNFIVKKNGVSIGVVSAKAGSDGKTYVLTVNQPLSAGDTYSVSMPSGAMTIAGGTVGAPAQPSAQPQTSAKPSAAVVVNTTAKPTAAAPAQPTVGNTTATPAPTGAQPQTPIGNMTAAATQAPTPTPSAPVSIDGMWELAGPYDTEIIEIIGNTAKEYLASDLDWINQPGAVIGRIVFTSQLTPDGNGYSGGYTHIGYDVKNYFELISPDQLKVVSSSTKRGQTESSTSIFTRANRTRSLLPAALWG